MIDLTASPSDPLKKFKFFETALISCSALMFLLAPFTWTYLARFQGLLFRPVDVAMFLIVLLTIARGRMILNFGPIPVLLALISVSLMLQFMFRGGSEYLLSSLKILYYLTMAMCIATAIRISLDRPNWIAEVSAILIVSPIYILFLLAVSAQLSEIFLMFRFGSIFEITRGMWHLVFSENLFGPQIDLDVTGVEFRNSAGIAFLVAGLFFSLSPTRIGRVLVIFFMIIAATLFSRSVWALQLVFVSLSLFASRPQVKLIWFVGVVSVGLGLLAFDGLQEAVETRVLSNFGRADSWVVAINSLDKNFFWGVLGAERVLLPEGEIKAVHNVPLALGLKAGVFVLLLSALAQLWFLITSLRAMKALLARPQHGASHLVVLVVVSLLLFVRPMLSASHSVYFSIGEWCALGLFLALSTALSMRTEQRGSE